MCDMAGKYVCCLSFFFVCSVLYVSLSTLWHKPYHT